MTTSDPDAWVTTRVEALEAANGVTEERVTELEERVGRLETALKAQRAAFAAAAQPDSEGPTVEQNATRASRAQEGRTGQERRDQR